MIEGKKTKNGSMYYCLFKAAKNQVLTKLVGEANLDSVERETEETKPNYGDYAACKPKSFGVFVHDSKLAFVKYNLWVNLKSGKSSYLVRPDSKRLTISFRKGKMYLYRVNTADGKIKISNFTFQPEVFLQSFKETSTIFCKKRGSEGKAALQVERKICELIFEVGQKNGVFQKRFPKKVFKLANILYAGLFPHLQPFLYEGLNIETRHLDSCRELRNNPIDRAVRRTLKIKGKKKGTVRTVIDSMRLNGRDIKFFSPFILNVYSFFEGILSEDHLQNVCKLTKSLIEEDLTSLDFDELPKSKNDQKRIIEALSQLAVKLVRKVHALDGVTVAAVPQRPRVLLSPNRRTEATRALLAQFPPETIIALWKDILSPNKRATESSDFKLHYLIDAATQWNERSQEIPLQNIEFRGVKELHDIIVREYRKLKDKDFSIEVSERCQSIEGIQISEEFPAHIVFPRSKYQLHDWGLALNNCIAGYAERARTKQCLLIGVEKEGNLLYTLEVDKTGRLVQFRGKHNKPAEKEHEEVVKQFLEQAGIFGTGNIRLNEVPWDLPLENEELKGASHG